MYDVERFGIINTGNPKHADIFVVTGSVNEQNKYVIKNIYDQMPDPKVVVAIGICATSGGVFRECYNVSGGIDMVIPVDVYVPGCAARPESIIDGIVAALGILEEKRSAMVTGAPQGAPGPGCGCRKTRRRCVNDPQSADHYPDRHRRTGCPYGAAEKGRLPARPDRMHAGRRRLRDQLRRSTRTSCSPTCASP